MNPLRTAFVLGLLTLAVCAAGADANRLTYLDDGDPFYPHRTFPKLITPQWVGETGVEAVVVLAIDDMRETPKYETFLRPILERLKKIDGRAPVSIMVNAIAPENAQLQSWLKEGLSLEVHTLAHPCPCLAKGSFDAAWNTYQGCIELMNQIPGNKPVAFRMPCCDSMNSPSPRFYSEIFNRTNAAGQFLTIDSSVMCILTTNDTTLPRDLVLDADGREKFRKYLPTETNATTRVSMKSFRTTIEDYPYPYVIDKLCWEFPAMIPSDWEAYNLHGSTNPVTLADWKSALDAVVLKQGVFSFIFHPHGWSSPAQFIEFIDYATAKYGKRVKFLTFKEALERLDKNLLKNHPLRDRRGASHEVRVVDVNNDGYMDVVTPGVDESPTFRTWAPKERAWKESAAGTAISAGGRFGILTAGGEATYFDLSKSPGAWLFEPTGWTYKPELLGGLYGESALLNKAGGSDHGVRLRDLDHDGRCELIVGNPTENAIFTWIESEKTWKKLPYALPKNTRIVDEEGRDAGLRFVDVNGDGYDDVLVYNEKEFSLHLFIPKANPRLMWDVGWNDEVWSGKRGESDIDIPPIVRAGTNRNNGVWFKNGTMWIQNEDTAALPDKVDRRTFRELLTADQPPALSPEQALASMRPRRGFQVELAAAEPLVQDPIAFEWGADGRLWVVELTDYPLGRVVPGADKPTRAPHGEEVLTPPEGGHYTPGGRIKVLEDTDGDGRYDKATVFLDNLNFPTGVMPWRNGILVSAAPEIFYAEDTDGDGKADKRTTLFTGFVEGNQQHRVNGFDYGLDNWVYAANGESGGVVKSTLLPSAPAVALRGHDCRFRPDTGAFETVAGTTQYGRHRDDWGNWFGNNNPVWLWHYFLPEQYLERNPNLAVKTTRQMLANYPDSTRLYPASRTRQRFNDHHQFGHVTSGNSAMPYRDEVFGSNFATSVFISDPVHNLVHREVLEPDGVTFTSHRAPDETNSEFLASTDLWFRPTMLKTGPDGALYIADMYRLVIEHPEWIPKWMQQRLDLRAGWDKGRIYRVFPEGATLRKIPNLARLDNAGLVAALDSPNGWQRDTAQRLLVHRADKSVVEPLERLSASATNPKVRLQALCTLDGIGSGSNAIVRAIGDPHPAVREHAWRLAEPYAKQLIRTMTAVSFLPSQERDVRVRYQMAFTFGSANWPETAAGPLLKDLARKDAENQALRTAILSSAPRVIDSLLSEIYWPELVDLGMALNKQDAIAVAVRARHDTNMESAENSAAFGAFLDGLERRGKSFDEFAVERRTVARDLVEALEKWLAAARSTALTNSAVGEIQRKAAVRLLGRTSAGHEADLKCLGELLGAQHPVSLQQAALGALARQKNRDAADALLSAWASQGPALRTESLNVILTRPDWCRALLAALQKGQIPPAQIGAAFQQKLLTHSDRSVSERAAELFAAASKDRVALTKQYAVVTQLTGDSGRGVGIYRKQCSTCHRLRGEGSDVGPDLGALGSKDVPTLLVAILDPNRAVEARYVNYTATTRDDRELSGIISSESGNSITLRAPGGREETVLRSDLNRLTSSGLSLMPEGLEKLLTPQDMADLLAALAGK